MNHKIVLAGVGGQGILFSTKILSETAASRGFDIIGSETHGMSQRGGSVASFLKIGAYSSPLVMKGEADFLYAFHQDETIRNLVYLRKGGCLFADAPEGIFTPELVKWLIDNRITAKTVPAGEMALKMGAPMSANLVLLGFSSIQEGSPFNPEELKETISRVTPEKFLKANLECFQAGMDAKGCAVAG